MQHSARILVIDDDPNARAFVAREVLRIAPRVELLDIRSPPQLDEHLRLRDFDVAVIEARTQWTDGLTVLRRLKSACPDLPVIMFTARGGEEFVVEAMKQGLDDYVSKRPEQRMRLAPAVHACLRARPPSRQAASNDAPGSNASESDLSIMFDVSGIGMAHVDPRTGRYLRVNRKLCEITGYDEDELLTRTVHDLTHPEDRQRDSELFQWLLSGELASYSHEKRYVRKDGSIVWVRINASVQRDGSGRPVRTSGVIEDITERKNFEAQRQALLEQEHASRLEAERVSRLKDEFLATLGHELRTPLNAILGWARLLESGRLGPDEVQRGAHTIARNARALGQLVNDLLDMSGMMSGKIRIEAEETDLCEIIEAAVETVQAAADAKGVKLYKHIESSACLVFGDPHRLQQVIWNLVNNAVKFTPRGGRIDISLKRTNGNCEVRVADTGIGIQPDFLPFVFDRFRQADASSRRQYAGLGLGLAIVKQLVELHGGTVAAHSEGEGKGATFIVTLPRLAPREDTGTHPRPAFAPGVLNDQGEAGPIIDLEGLRVLVVDDESDTLDLVKRVLGDNRAEVTTAPSVDAALTLLSRFTPDVLISDISMPGRDGYELIRAVRATSSAEELPAAALTAFARPEDAVRAHEAGFQMHLAKPLEPEELVRVVAQLAGRA